MKQDTKHEPEISTGRLEAFSDGVFAIAITLLIIEIKVPTHAELAEQSLLHYLWELWPKYSAYILSFVILGIYWANHHYLFKLFRSTDHAFNLLNIMFLMTIAFLPFPTGVLGEHIMDPGHRNTAVSFYALSIWMPAFCWLLIWLYASHRKRLLQTGLASSFVKTLTNMYVFSNFLYMIAFVASLFNYLLSISLCIGLSLLYLLPPKKAEYTSHSE